MVDFHSHILPGIDDGSESVAESLAMLRLSAEQGVTHAVATPHFYPDQDTPRKFLRRRDRAETALRQEMAKHRALPELIMGAEVRFFRGMSEAEELNLLTIGASPFLLVEMPPVPWSEEMYRELEEIYRKREITPVIAHIDRYLSPLGSRKSLRRLMELPVLIQANGEFFLNWKTEALAFGMLKAGQIHLLGSDCHNLKTRKPNLGPALERIVRKLGEEAPEDIRQYEHEILGVMPCYETELGV